MRLAAALVAAAVAVVAVLVLLLMRAVVALCFDPDPHVSETWLADHARERKP